MYTTTPFDAKMDMSHLNHLRDKVMTLTDNTLSIDPIYLLSGCIYCETVIYNYNLSYSSHRACKCIINKIIEVNKNSIGSLQIILYPLSNKFRKKDGYYNVRIFCKFSPYDYNKLYNFKLNLRVLSINPNIIYSNNVIDNYCRLYSEDFKIDSNFILEYTYKIIEL
jgi:hypothetical protein